MRTKLHLIICLAAAALFVAACSSTTVVARDDRAATSTSSAPDEADGAADQASDDEPGAAPVDEDVETFGSDAAVDDEPVDVRSAAKGFGLGGAEQLESLLSDCQSGSNLACDVLFQISDFDSAEEDAAMTCGGRSDTTVTFCTDGIDEADDALTFDVTSDGLEAVVDQCTDDGDMTACDFLFYRSPLGSEFEDIGASCGNRVPVAVPDCRTFLPEAE